VFERHGYVAYDPQLERLFEPDRDAAVAADVHRSVRETLDLAEAASSASNPGGGGSSGTTDDPLGRAYAGSIRR
jgi:hypothetical protein